MKKLCVYLDNCCFNRPYDDQEQHKILLETEAKLQIQTTIKLGKMDLIWSYMLDFENNENPNEIIRSAISEWKALSICDIVESEKLLLNAERIQGYGIDTKDSIHIACAIAGKADIFFTTDNSIIKQSKGINDLKILNPVHFFTESD